MPSRAAMADMQYDIDNRQRLVTARLMKRLNLPEPGPTEWTRNPELARIFMQRQHVEFLESLDAALKGEGYSAASGAEGKTDDVDNALSVDGVHLTAEVTQDGTPVVATESIDQEAADAAVPASDNPGSATNTAPAQTAKAAKAKTVKA